MSSNPIYIFDVDGTITPSRKSIDDAFHDWFIDFASTEEVYLVTGSDAPKTVEQVGEAIYNSCRAVYQCSGNEKFIRDELIYEKPFVLPREAKDWLKRELFLNVYPDKAGMHIEERKCATNFSIVGRAANTAQRQNYVKWDKERNERMDIAERFVHEFPHLEAVVGGDTGIDIYPLGNDKGQIMNDFSEEDQSRIIFFGDACHYGGNDYSIAKACVKHFNVKDWRETWSILEFTRAGKYK